jgi:hypothetical protein
MGGGTINKVHRFKLTSKTCWNVRKLMHVMAPPMYSTFHPKPPGVSGKSKEALARGLNLMITRAMNFGCPEDARLSWWNTKVENIFRCRMAGKR